MSDDDSTLPSLTDPAPKRRGRKPGAGKVPGSGRKPGSKNKVSPDLRQTILTRGRPVELLCDIARGVKIRVGPQGGPGEPQYQYPTLQERATAAKLLLDKVAPTAAPLPPIAEDHSNSPDEALRQLAPGASARQVEAIDAARRIAFIFSRARAATEEIAAKEAAAAREAQKAEDEASGVERPKRMLRRHNSTPAPVTIDTEAVPSPSDSDTVMMDDRGRAYAFDGRGNVTSGDPGRTYRHVPAVHTKRPPHG